MAKFKSKYEALNYINEKHDAYFCEITDWEDARYFWENFVALWRLGKVSDNDMKLGEIAMDRF